ncbi:MAG: glycosyltransferase family 1 protein [Patescibacteria group bacterium]
MTIGIDGNEANVENLVGVSVYTHKLLIEFQKKSDANNRFVIYLKNAPLPHLPNETEYFRYQVVWPSLLWSQIPLPIHLFLHNKIDRFFSPAHYAPRFATSPTVVTVHDLSYFYYPEDFLKADLYKLKKWTGYSVKNARNIIAVSKQTKKDIVKFYKILEEKITVIYNGHEKIQSAKRKVQKATSPYILYVGTLQPRKNIKTLVEAFSSFSIHNSSFKLILVGKKGWMYEDILKSVNTSKCKDNIEIKGYVSDEELVTLYQNAFCYVNPSLYEGFGIPVLEAMAQDCPVLSSDTGALPEIAGNAALYFNPEKVEELVNQLELLKNNKENLREELIKKGRERIKQFSWEKCAQQTLTLLKNT